MNFCSPVDKSGELYADIQQRIEVYHESKQTQEGEFQADDDEERQCHTIKLSVVDAFYESLRDDMAEIIDEYHDCSTAIIEDGSGASVQGECAISVEDGA